MAKFTVGQQATYDGRAVEIVGVLPSCSFISPAYQVREANAILTVPESKLSPVPLPPKFKIGDRVFHYDGSAGTVEARCCERYIVAFDRVGYLAVDEQDLSDYPPKFAIGQKVYVLVSGNEPESTFWDAGEIIGVYKGRALMYSVRCRDALRHVYDNKLATCVPTYNCQCKTDYSFVYEDLKRRLDRVEGILKHHNLS